MEVDSDADGEPLVKRMNIPSEKHDPRSRTMMADRVEIGHQLGKRIDDGHGVGNVNIHERLGEFENVDTRTSFILNDI